MNLFYLMYVQIVSTDFYVQHGLRKRPRPDCVPLSMYSIHANVVSTSFLIPKHPTTHLHINYIRSLSYLSQMSVLGQCLWR